MGSRVDDTKLAELSALADGTLDPARRAEVQAWIAASPELTALYERERSVAALLHKSAAEVRAPAHLRARVEAERERAARGRVPRRVGYGGALAGALAAIALALVLILPAGTPGSPSVSQAAALAGRGPSAAAPAVDPGAPNVKLGRSIEDVYFPNWTKRFGWRANGQRSDLIGGRRALTVYYTWHGRRLAYTIVGAPALRQPAAQVTVLGGTALRTLVLG